MFSVVNRFSLRSVFSRITLYIAIFSSFLVIAVVSIKSYVAYNSEINEMKSVFKSIDRRYASLIAQAAWDFNEPLLKSYMNSILEMPYISSAKISIVNGPILELGTPLRSGAESFQIDLYSEREGRLGNIGSVFIVADVNSVRKTVAMLAAEILLVDAIIIFIASAMTISLLHYMIGRRVRSIANHFIGLDEGNLNCQFVLSKTLGVPQGDEIDTLVGIINAAHDRIKCKMMDISNMSESLHKEIEARVKVEEKLNSALERSQCAISAKSEFLANMSHEIRTPLNGIIGMLQLLETTGLTQEQKEYVCTALRSSKRLTSLLSDILDLSVIDSGKMIVQEVEFDIRNLKEALLDLFGVAAKDKGLDFTFDFDMNLPNVLMGDETRVRQVIFNLVGNSIKFTQSGAIHVEAVALSSLMDGVCRVLLVVRDTGEGMRDEIQRRIFEPFVQGEGAYVRRFQGAGLGLSLVVRMVDLLGGDLSIESEPGKGTAVYVSFSFKIPSSRKCRAVAPLKSTLKPEGRGLRILFAEDDAVTRFSVKKLLEKSGHKVILAVNGVDALNHLEKEPFDLILMDIQMPEMDGVEATRAIRFQDRFNEVRNIPIIAVTAYTMIGDREIFLGAGMDGYISKPVDIKELRSLINVVMTGS